MPPGSPDDADATHTVPPVAKHRRHVSEGGSVAAGREVLDAFTAASAAKAPAPAAGPMQARPQRSAPVEVDPAPAPAPPRGRDRTPAVTSTTTNADFEPRRGARRLLGLVVLVSLAATAAAGYLAYDDPTTLTVGAAVTLGLLTLVLWAVRAGSATTRLAIRSGQLEVVRGGSRQVFDLNSSYTRIEQVGTPGRAGWKVLIDRPDAAPFVIDASLVDPRAFAEALARFRTP